MIRIAISSGDTGGIGPEIILKSLTEVERNNTAYIVYGGSDLLRYMDQAKTKLDLSPLEVIDDLDRPGLYYLDVWPDGHGIEPGARNVNGGKAALASLQTAVDHLLEGAVDGLVTAPIDKENIRGAGFDFPGHTEYLAARAGQDDALMLLVAQDLRVAVVTGHIPVSSIAQQVNADLLGSKCHRLSESLKSDFGIEEPRIAVLGLNPHAGDRGVIGREEIEWIDDRIDALRKEMAGVEGPFPADGFFGSGHYKRFDGILAMYHDQGLVPFKLLSFGQGVNFTAGLPFVRTSPDHGTAFDIAGQWQASAGSMKTAISLARTTVQRRMASSG